MALNKASTTTAAAAGAFESTAPWEDEATTTTAVAENTAETTKESTTTAVAAPARTAVVGAEKTRAFKEELDSMRDAVSFDYGVLPTFKGTNGSLRETGANGTRSFGSWVQGRMMAYSGFTQVSPGGSEQKLKGFVAFSRDNKTIDQVIGDGVERSYVGRSVQEYVDYLRNVEKLDKASAKPYLNIAILVTDSEKGDKSGVEAGDVVTLVLSQTSITSFTAYEEKLRLAERAAAMGLPGKALPDDPFMLRFTCEVTRNTQNQEWTKLNVAPAK